MARISYWVLEGWATDILSAAGLAEVDAKATSAGLVTLLTGRPITEPYWATVKVAGTEQEVLIQCFERRCLTYTPDNAPEWHVEAGNVGKYYYIWRSNQPVPAPPALPELLPPPPAPDLDCGDISARRFSVVGSGLYRLDGDNDGTGCES